MLKQFRDYLDYIKFEKFLVEERVIDGFSRLANFIIIECIDGLGGYYRERQRLVDIEKRDREFILQQRKQTQDRKLYEKSPRKLESINI